MGETGAQLYCHFVQGHLCDGIPLSNCDDEEAVVQPEQDSLLSSGIFGVKLSSGILNRLQENNGDHINVGAPGKSWVAVTSPVKYLVISTSAVTKQPKKACKKLETTLS